MPNKTIYVSNEDLQTFENAQKIAGDNLSSVIVRALKEFIARFEERGQGFKDITVQIGVKGVQSEKHFTGRLIAKWRGLNNVQDAWLEAQVYRTKKDNFAVVLENKGNPKLWNGWKNRNSPELWQQMPETSLFVFSKLDEVADKLPESLQKVITNAAEQDESPVEFLDI